LIPRAYLQEWSAKAPWPDLRQVEQDLIICRALCDLFSAPTLRHRIAFRGGTAINKLLFARPLRYSEDIDLMQTRAEPIDAIRETLSWLGQCNRDRAEHSIHLIFRFAPEADAAEKLKLKIELNTREHESVHGVAVYPFVVESGWYRGRADIASFAPEEIFATKLRALLQRRKNRDLFDLNEGLKRLSMDVDKLIDCFQRYLALEGTSINRATAKQRMLQKMSRSLSEDVVPLLPTGVRFNEEDALAAFENIWFALIVRFKGGPWKRSQDSIAEIRLRGIPGFLRGGVSP